MDDHWNPAGGAAGRHCAGPPAVQAAAPQLVDHDGRPHLLQDLLRRLPADVRGELEAAMPRGGQAAWDEVVRRRPTLADAIAKSSERACGTCAPTDAG